MSMPRCFAKKLLVVLLGYVSASLVYAQHGVGAGRTNPVVAEQGSLLTIDAAQKLPNTLVAIQRVRDAHPLYLFKLYSAHGDFHCVADAANSGGRLLTFQCANAVSVARVQLSVIDVSNRLVLGVQSDSPEIVRADIKPFGVAAAYRSIPTPYLTTPVLLWNDDRLFTRVQVNWRKSSASTIRDDEVVYDQLTSGIRRPLREEIQIAAAFAFDDVLPAIDNPPSPYRSEMAGKTVFDIWESHFDAIAQGFARLAEYGIAPCLGIVHDWQYFGYDNGLPQHLPANPKSGGDAGLSAAIQAGKSAGCRMAVHENYVDYYRNYPGYTDGDVARKSNGDPQLAWFNRSTKQQSYAVKPSRMVALARQQSPQIRSLFKTDASYLDVNSAVDLSFHDDMDASAPHAGYARFSTESSADLWAYLRKTYSGPALGEGARHWYYSGLLDGVEAQFGIGGTRSNAEGATPLLVDFDLLRIHPLQVNHGMGYYERWTANQSRKPSAAQLDAYRMQEIAFGHAPFLGQGLWKDIAQALIETHLVSPVAASYGEAKASRIEYGDHGSWISSTQAVLENKLSQVRVRYDNALEVVANAAAENVRWQQLQIPQYGWAAKSPTLFAYSALCGDRLCDFAETADSIFANARDVLSIDETTAPGKVSAAGFAQNGPRKANLVVTWEVFDPAAFSHRKPFVHFVPEADNRAPIAFQAPSQLASLIEKLNGKRGAVQDSVPIAVPASVADGVYSVRIGAYDPATGARQTLAGVDDGQTRYILGTLTIRENGQRLQWNPVEPVQDRRSNYDRSVLDFGVLRTNSLVWMNASRGVWTLHTYPQDASLYVALNGKRFVLPPEVQAEHGSSPTVRPYLKDGYWVLPLNGATSYVWRTK